MDPPERIIGSERLYIATVIKFTYLTMFVCDILVPVRTTGVVRVEVNLIGTLPPVNGFDLLKRDPPTLSSLRKFLEPEILQFFTTHLQTLPTQWITHPRTVNPATFFKLTRNRAYICNALL